MNDGDGRVGSRALPAADPAVAAASVLLAVYVIIDGPHRPVHRGSRAGNCGRETLQVDVSRF